MTLGQIGNKESSRQANQKVRIDLKSFVFCFSGECAQALATANSATKLKPHILLLPLSTSLLILLLLPMLLQWSQRCRQHQRQKTATALLGGQVGHLAVWARWANRLQRIRKHIFSFSPPDVKIVTQPLDDNY